MVGWCGVVWFVIGFLVDRGRVEVSFQGLERIAYLAVYVLFVLPVNLQTYSRARAKPALIAADGSKGN